MCHMHFMHAFLGHIYFCLFVSHHALITPTAHTSTGMQVRVPYALHACLKTYIFLLVCKPPCTHHAICSHDRRDASACAIRASCIPS